MIIYNNWIPFGYYKIFNFFGIIFSKDKTLDAIDINHEKIHTKQIIELALLGLSIILTLDIIIGLPMWIYLFGISLFYIWYGIEYLIVRCFHKKLKDGYHDISLEEEAYAYEKDLLYLKHRKYFNWIKYLNINK